MAPFSFGRSHCHEPARLVHVARCRISISNAVGRMGARGSPGTKRRRAMLCGAGGHAIVRVTGQTNATTTPGIAIESKQQFSLIGGGNPRSVGLFGRCAEPASSLLKV